MFTAKRISATGNKPGTSWPMLGLLLACVALVELVVGAIELGALWSLLTPIIGAFLRVLTFMTAFGRYTQAEGYVTAIELPAAVIIRGLLLGGITFGVGLVMGKPMINWLRSRRILKQVNRHIGGHHSHKTGTPSMGGIIFILPVMAVMLVFTDVLNAYRSLWLPISVMVGMAALGAIDDLMSTMDNNRGGITARAKMAGLLAISIAAAWVLHGPLGYHSVYVPFVPVAVDLGWFYVPAAILVIAGTANAVNLADGLDTLAGGTTTIAFIAYAIIALLQKQPHVVILCLVTVGALLAFLWFNAHPAQVFMGDAGALTLGALLAVCALMTNQWLLLPMVGLVFVIEVLSDVAQVAYFKFTGGKRLLRKAPIHHHFEELGWAETQISVRFWLLAIFAAMLGVALALI